MTTSDDPKKAAKLAQLQALSAAARATAARPPLPPRPPLRQDVRANSFGDILPPPQATQQPPPPSPPAATSQSSTQAASATLPIPTPSPSTTSLGHTATLSPTSPVSAPATRPKTTPATIDWETLKIQGKEFVLEENSRPVGVRCSQDVFDRLTEGRIQTGLDRGHICAFLLQTHLPKPTKAHVRRGDELAAAALARELRLAKEYLAPDWLIHYDYDSRALRPHTIAVPVGRILYAYISEASLRIGLPMVALVEATVMRYLPPATSSYSKRRR